MNCNGTCDITNVSHVGITDPKNDLNLTQSKATFRVNQNVTCTLRNSNTQCLSLILVFEADDDLLTQSPKYPLPEIHPPTGSQAVIDVVQAGF